MCNTLSTNIVQLILEHYARIIYKNEKYNTVNKLNLSDKKFDDVKKIIEIKASTLGKIKLQNFGPHRFYIDYYDEKTRFGIIRNYNYYGDGYCISFYKDIKDTFGFKFNRWWKRKILNIHQLEDSYFITNHEYL
jgi:hypothetical protein